MKTNLHAKFHTDREKEQEGNWVTISAGVEFLIARYGGANQYKVSEKMAKIYNDNKDKMVIDNLKDEEIAAWILKKNELLQKAFIEVSVLDWRGLTDDGNPIPFSVDNCYELFQDLHDVRDMVIDYAHNRENYLKDKVGN